ncbi:MAG TPA: Pvc16 family protein, partial [Thauera sp.]|nr:Pvc16 family protein [Thauera sp.]
SELPTEDLMRIWDALSPSYRLSVSWVARLVRIDPERDDTLHRPVVAGRFRYAEDAS